MKEDAQVITAEIGGALVGLEANQLFSRGRHEDRNAAWTLMPACVSRVASVEVYRLM